MTNYYTFGRDHRVLGEPMDERYVSVTVPTGWDHRLIMSEWLMTHDCAPNAFASEYTESEFADYMRRYAPDEYAAVTVEVKE
jgi:hypothetical protein